MPTTRYTQTALRRAFTLIELLVTILLIALLAGLLVVSLRGVIFAGERTQSTNALRQLGMAYASYSADYNQQLMPGYISPDKLNQLRINPELDDGTSLYPSGGATEAGSSYVWRLAPYLQWDWRVSMGDYGHPGIESRLADQILANNNRLEISQIPSFGLNTMFLGGDDTHAGIWANENPWDVGTAKSMAATRVSQVNQPSRIITFAPTQSNNIDDIYGGDPPFNDLHFGAPSLRPPFLEFDSGLVMWVQRQWTPIDSDGNSSNTRFFADGSATYDHGTSGWIVARHGDSVPAAHLDGSVTTAGLFEYAYDMRMWSPSAGSIRPRVLAPETRP